MTLGERCDEIMRLIDETLSSFGEGSEGAAPASVEPPLVAAVRTLARADQAKLAKSA
ncbi:MAG: hypothetical protein ACYDA2_10505 [Acidimicrobiales bacterium]